MKEIKPGASKMPTSCFTSSLMHSVIDHMVFEKVPLPNMLFIAGDVAHRKFYSLTETEFSSFSKIVAENLLCSLIP